MALISKNLLFTLLTFVILNVMTSAHAEIVIKGSVELPHQIDGGIIHGHANLSHGTPILESTIEPKPQIAPADVVAPEFSPVSATLDAPVIDTVNASVTDTGTPPGNPVASQPGAEPYVMLLVGLGMIVFAIALHLKSMHRTRSGFKPSQGMPFV